MHVPRVNLLKACAPVLSAPVRGIVSSMVAQLKLSQIHCRDVCRHIHNYQYMNIHRHGCFESYQEKRNMDIQLYHDQASRSTYSLIFNQRSESKRTQHKLHWQLRRFIHLHFPRAASTAGQSKVLVNKRTTGSSQCCWKGMERHSNVQKLH